MTWPSLWEEMVSQKYRGILLDVSLIMIIGAMVLLWFQGGLLIDGGDFDFPLSPGYTIDRHLSLWDEKLDGGYASSRNIVQFPYQLFVYLLYQIGFSLGLIERILFYLLFTSFGLSMYFLTRHIVDEPYKRLGAILAAMFYMGNPFHATFTWAQIVLNIFLFAFLPLVLLFYIRILSKLSLLNILGLGTSFFLIMPAFTNPALVVTAWIPLFLYLFCFILIDSDIKEVWKKAIYGTVATVVVFLLVNAWWIFPLSTTISQEYSDASQATVGYSNVGVLMLNSKYSSFLNTFRLLGHWALYEGFEGDPYYTWTGIFDSLGFVTVTFIVPIVAFSILLSRKEQHLSLYFAPLCVIGLFLIKGSHGPLGRLSLWFYENIAVFGAFRNQYEKFGILLVLGYSVLFGLSLSALMVFMKNKAFMRMRTVEAMFGALVVIFFAVYQSPFWSGNVIFAGGKVLRSYHIEIPNYYLDANAWIRGDRSKHRVLEVPISGLHGVMFEWENGYQGANPTWRLIEMPMLSTVHRNPVLYVLERDLEGKDVKRLAGLLSIMNVRFVLAHGDLHASSSAVNLGKVRSTLSCQEDIALVKRFGKLEFYRVADKEILPHIYASALVMREPGVPVHR